MSDERQSTRRVAQPQLVAHVLVQYNGRVEIHFPLYTDVSSQINSVGVVCRTSHRTVPMDTSRSSIQ